MWRPSLSRQSVQVCTRLLAIKVLPVLCMTLQYFHVSSLWSQASRPAWEPWKSHQSAEVSASKKQCTLVATLELVLLPCGKPAGFLGTPEREHAACSVKTGLAHSGLHKGVNGGARHYPHRRPYTTSHRQKCGQHKPTHAESSRVCLIGT